MERSTSSDFATGHSAIPVSPRDHHMQIESDGKNSLTHALIATVNEPLAILDVDLRAIAASRSYRKMFPSKFPIALDSPFGELSAPLWDAPVLQLLHDVLSRGAAIEDLEIQLDVPQLGRRRMLLNARRVNDEANRDAAMLVALEDLTAKGEADDLKAELLEKQQMLLLEVHHRVANSLQIIASILLMKARMVQSEETRLHLHDVHHRLVSVATVQRQLSVTLTGNDVELGGYLAALCESLATSMIADDHGVTIASSATAGTIKSEDAVSFGLIVTELVINSLKHGFPDGGTGRIDVDFVRDGAAWRLAVGDDGVGHPPGQTQAGLGTSIVEALAKSLHAKVEVGRPDRGSATTIIHAA
jgi:two-component sensor histidine kinase